jgi:hypothetical protein
LKCVGYPILHKPPYHASAPFPIASYPVQLV